MFFFSLLYRKIYAIHTHTLTILAELLSSWESLLHWSENESFVKQSREEMAALVDKLNKIGTSEPNLDTESAIQFAIQETKVSFCNFIFNFFLNETKNYAIFSDKRYLKTVHQIPKKQTKLVLTTKNDFKCKSWALRKEEIFWDEIEIQNQFCIQPKRIFDIISFWRQHKYRYMFTSPNEFHFLSIDHITFSAENVCESTFCVFIEIIPLWLWMCFVSAQFNHRKFGFYVSLGQSE